jgi:hypothetical protein
MSSPGGKMPPTLELNKIQEVAQVSIGKAKQLMETCVWCLLNRKHKNGLTMRVVDGVDYSYLVTWRDKDIDEEALSRSYNDDDAIEAGAEAIAFLISIARTPFNAVERATTTTGIDYWLGYKDNPNNPFERAGRLEVSGILAENESNTVKARIRNKLKQTAPTDNSFSVYVIVVEFGEPYTTMVLKS